MKLSRKQKFPFQNIDVEKYSHEVSLHENLILIFNQIVRIKSFQARLFTQYISHRFTEL
jgi:hypothetical protein